MTLSLCIATGTLHTGPLAGRTLYCTYLAYHPTAIRPPHEGWTLIAFVPEHSMTPSDLASRVCPTAEPYPPGP